MHSGGETVDFKVEYRGAFSILFVDLQPGEEVRAETGTMVSMEGDVEVETSTGGFLKAIKRMLGGESFFMNIFRAKGPSRVAFAPRLPGDIEIVDLSGTIYVQSSSYLASETSLDIDSKFGGHRSFFAGEGLFLLRVSGMGKVALSSFGAIYSKSLEPGERMIVDTGHVVAFDEGVNYTVRTFGGLKSFMFGGEGLVVEFTGPGRVYIQTRNTPDFMEWIKMLAKEVVGEK